MTDTSWLKPNLVNGKAAKAFIEEIDEPIRKLLLQRVFDMAIINTMSEDVKAKYEEIEAGEFDMYFYVVLMNRLLGNKLLLQEYLDGEFTEDTAF